MINIKELEENVKSKLRKRSRFDECDRLIVNIRDVFEVVDDFLDIISQQEQEIEKLKRL